MPDCPVYLVTTNLAPHDAIGNDVLGMRETLLRAGYRAEAYAADVHPSLTGVARPLNGAGEFWRDPNALLIYHHSMGWPAGLEILESAQCRVAVKYHNVTPPRFFEPYSEAFTQACRGGEAANFRVAAHRSAMFWGDSTFNSDDLVRNGAPRGRCRVIAPFHNTEAMAEIPLDRQVLNRRGGNPGATILFVGGVKPNKGHLQLLRVFAAYRRKYDRGARLLVAGGMDPRLASYTGHLQDAARAYELGDSVTFTGAVSAAALRSYYLLSDVFLCLSEHEGFCVPLIEAMFFRSPVIAAASTAIPETVGDAGILWPEDDLAHFVESIAVCMENQELRRALQEKGWDRFQKFFRRDALAPRFLTLVEEALAR
ncbi:MAG TPA: glycosyltransferase [Bryobacteraceae bacterium]|jgi:glycosyltransferase involved in cell wall biosynthesis|nr:glycosyltransferase [Bryobacteraceae bacterium]